MFAVVKTGGKQYKVAQGDVIRVEKLPGAAGDTVEFGQVLMLGEGAEATVGNPLVEGAAVTATVLEQKRDDTVLVFKKKRRHNYRRKRGHRQYLTVLRISGVFAPGAERPAAAAAAETAATEAAGGGAAEPKKRPARKRTTAKSAAGKSAAGADQE